MYRCFGGMSIYSFSLSYSAFLPCSSWSKFQSILTHFRLSPGVWSQLWLHLDQVLSWTSLGCCHNDKMVVKLTESFRKSHNVFNLHLERIPHLGTQWSNLSEDILSRLLIFNTSLHLHQMVLRAEHSKWTDLSIPQLSLSPLWSIPPSVLSIPPSPPPSHPLILWISWSIVRGRVINMNNSLSTFSYCWNRRTVSYILCRGQQTNKPKQTQHTNQNAYLIIMIVNKYYFQSCVELSRAYALFFGSLLTCTCTCVNHPGVCTEKMQKY